MNSRRKLQEGKHITIFHHTEKNYLHTWIQTHPNTLAEDLLKKELLDLQNAIRKTIPQSIVINIKAHYHIPTYHFMSWLNQHFFLPIIRSGIYRICVVHGDNISVLLDFEEAIRKYKSHSLALASFYDEREAIEWCLQ